jgi:hypothetical protein
LIRIPLPPQEISSLQHAFRTTTDRRLRDRLHRAIAEDLGIVPRSVQRWLNAYLERGLDGLRPRRAPGAQPRLTADLAPLLQQWAIDGPANSRNRASSAAVKSV